MRASEIADHFDARDVDRERLACPRSSKLLDAIEQVLTHVLPAFPEPGSDAQRLKDLSERCVIAIEYDLQRGVDSRDNDVAYVEEKLREARSL
jgi:hypothetical protein